MRVQSSRRYECVLARSNCNLVKCDDLFTGGDIDYQAGHGKSDVQRHAAATVKQSIGRGVWLQLGMMFFGGGLQRLVVWGPSLHGFMAAPAILERSRRIAFVDCDEAGTNRGTADGAPASGHGWPEANYHRDSLLAFCWIVALRWHASAAQVAHRLQRRVTSEKGHRGTAKRTPP